MKQSLSRAQLRHFQNSDQQPWLVSTLNAIVDAIKSSGIPINIGGQFDDQVSSAQLPFVRSRKPSDWVQCLSLDDVGPFGLVEVYDGVWDANTNEVVLHVRKVTTSTPLMYAANEDYALHAGLPGWVRVVNSYAPVVCGYLGSNPTFLGRMSVASGFAQPFNDATGPLWAVSAPNTTTKRVGVLLAPVQADSGGGTNTSTQQCCCNIFNCMDVLGLDVTSTCGICTCVPEPWVMTTQHIECNGSSVGGAHFLKFDAADSVANVKCVWRSCTLTDSYGQYYWQMELDSDGSATLTLVDDSNPPPVTLATWKCTKFCCACENTFQGQCPTYGFGAPCYNLPPVICVTPPQVANAVCTDVCPGGVALAWTATFSGVSGGGCCALLESSTCGNADPATFTLTQSPTYECIWSYNFNAYQTTCARGSIGPFCQFVMTLSVGRGALAPDTHDVWLSIELVCSGIGMPDLIIYSMDSSSFNCTSNNTLTLRYQGGCFAGCTLPGTVTLTASSDQGGVVADSNGDPIRDCGSIMITPSGMTACTPSGEGPCCGWFDLGPAAPHLTAHVNCAAWGGASVDLVPAFDSTIHTEWFGSWGPIDGFYYRIATACQSDGIWCTRIDVLNGDPGSLVCTGTDCRPSFSSCEAFIVSGAIALVPTGYIGSCPCPYMTYTLTLA